MASITASKLFCTGLVILLIFACQGQTTQQTSIAKQPRVGGAFENPDMIYQGMPNVISAVDTSPGWKLAGQKIFITGTILNADGKTPAANVVLYYYQTNTAGHYVHDASEPRSMPPNEQGQTHGFIRGWVKTNANGKYGVYTVRPGIYPTRDAPAHIHATIKEPNEINEYWIDDFLFDDDTLLTISERKKLSNRGGNGILRLEKHDSIWVGRRDILLGKNIPDHPANGKW
jgi:protocatechuate 3,4-dioxygenase beta subunit